MTELWLGTWKLGGMHFGPYEEKTALATLALALETGITHFDTAHFYARGNSNKVLAKALKYTPRNQVYLSAKGGLNWQKNKVQKDASPKALKADLEKTLETLNTDHLDLYSLHHPDPQTLIEESLSTLKTFQSQGLIKSWGICNFTSEEVKTHIPKNAKIPHQIHHNLANPNKKTLKISSEAGRCKTIITSPLEQGLLTEKGLSHLTKNDHRSPLQNLNLNLNLNLKSTYNFLTKDQAIDTIITGARTPTQLSETLKYFKTRPRKSTSASK